MDRTEMLLSQADRRVVNQRRLAARLERDGEESSEARAELTKLEERRSQYLTERDRLLRKAGG
jgi:hypothetical protein